MTYPNTVISMPSQLFTMRSSFKAVANGSVYIGEVDTDPTIPTNQIQVYIEQENGTLVPVAQPIKINSAGFLTASGQVQKFVLTNTEYSMTVQNSYGVDEFYFPRVYDQGISAALEVEERLLGPGAKIYRGSNGQYIQNGDVIPSENPPYTHLAVPINGKTEDVAMSPVSTGVVSGLTEIGATIGVTPVSFYNSDVRVFPTINDLIASAAKETQKVSTLGRIFSGDGGGADYLVVSESTYQSLIGNGNGTSALGNGGDGTSEFYDVTLNSGLIAYKLKRDVVFTEELCDISDPSAVAGAFVASGHHGGKLYHMRDVVSNYITIDGSNKAWALLGHGKLTLADDQDNMVLRIDNCTEFMSVRLKHIDGNKFNQSPESRNLGAGLRFFNCMGGYEAVGVKTTNNHSGAGILVIDNASDPEVFDVPVCRIAFCEVRDCGDESFDLNSDGIFVNSDRCETYMNVVDTVTDYALAFDYSQNTKAWGNRCYNFLVAAGILGVKNFELYSNHFENGQLGVDVTLAGNDAIAPYISDGVKIHDNTVKNITVPGGLSGDAYKVDHSAKNVEIYSNTADGFLGRGFVSTCSDAFIHDNTAIGLVGQTGYFIGGSRTRFFDNESRDENGNSLIHNIASDLLVIDDRNSTYQRTSRTVTPTIGVSTRVAYLRSTGNNAAAILTMRVSQYYQGLGSKVVERKLKCNLTSNVFSFSQLSVVGDSSDIALTATPMSSGVAEITVNVTSGSATSATIQLEIVSISEANLGTIYIADRLR